MIWSPSETLHGLRRTCLANSRIRRTVTMRSMGSTDDRIRAANFEGSSVGRMSWAALLGVENWFRRAGISDPELDRWLDHLWQWSTVHPKTFDSWYQGRPDLVGLRDRLPENLQAQCDAVGLSAEDLRTAIKAVSEVIYVNLFGAITWDWVTEELDRLAEILSKYELGLPSPDCLPSSTSREGYGWGNHLDARVVDEIRALPWTTGC